jgi:hypothetical protein
MPFIFAGETIIFLEAALSFSIIFYFVQYVVCAAARHDNEI